MSEVFSERRPMIDLDEFEKRLCRSCSTEQKDGDLVAEFFRIIGDQDEPHKTDFEPKTQLSARARQDAGEPGEWQQPDAQVRMGGGNSGAIEAGLLDTQQPQAAILRDAERSTVESKRPNAPAPLISGNFAAIEAGLLGALQEKATAAVSETTMSNAFPSVDLGSERRPYQDNQPASRHGGAADAHIRPRRPLYVMMAIAIAGMAGIAVSFGLNSRVSGPPEFASVTAESGAVKLQGGIARGADVPAQDAAFPGKPPEPSPMAAVPDPGQTFDLPQAEAKTLPAESHAQLDNGPAAGPAAPAPAPIPAEPLNTAAPVAPDTGKTDLVRPDGTLLSNGTPPQANITNINGAPLPAPQSPAAAKAPAAKAAGRVAKPLKPATARHPGNHGQPRQIASKAKATPMSPLISEPAPSADPKAETPAAQPSPAVNGVFGFVQSALNSLTSTTAKLLEGGRIESGSRP